jgi:hypothetical protein
MAGPTPPAVVEVYDNALRHPGHLIVAYAGGLVAIDGVVDLAFLDVYSRSGDRYTVPDFLGKRGSLLLWTTGYGDRSLPKHLAGEKRLTQLYSARELEKYLQALADHVASSGNTGAGSK